MKTSDSTRTLQMAMRRRTLNLRAIDRLIQGSDFEDLWENATDDERGRLLEAVQQVDVETVRRRLAEMQRLELCDLTKRELVDLARRYHVKNYSRKTKTQLVTELQKYDKAGTRGHPETTG